LARLATFIATRRAGTRVQILYEGVWAYRAGCYIFPRSDTFDFNARAWKEIALHEANCRANARELWLQFYEPQPGDTIIDIGSGRGEDAFVFAEAVGPTGRVLAVEAHPASFGLLHSFCALNDLKNITPINRAISDKAHRVGLTDSDDWQSNSIGAPDGEKTPIQIDACTLDALCDQEGITQIAFIKMNIEGEESSALRGMERVLSRCNTVCVAYHDFRSERGHGEQFRTRAFVTKFLADRGFKVVLRDADPRDYVRDHVFGLRTTGDVP
jgi:FkbM family methyltransferase